MTTENLPPNLKKIPNFLQIVFFTNSNSLILYNVRSLRHLWQLCYKNSDMYFYKNI